MPEFSQIHTACRDCYFSTTNGKTQVGCELDRIEAYEKAGADVISAYDDTGNEFFVINDRICPYNRTKEWASEFSKSEVSSIVESQVKIPYQAIIFQRGSVVTDQSRLVALNNTIAHLVKQYNPPSLVSIISNVKEKKLYKENMALSSILSCHAKIFDWRVHNMIDNSFSNRSAIDLVIDSTYKENTAYYMVFEAGFKPTDEMSKEFLDSVYVDGKQPIFCHPIGKTLNGMMANKIIHRKHGGNSFTIHLEDKVKEFEENAEKHIFNIEDLCPSLKA